MEVEMYNYNHIFISIIMYIALLTDIQELLRLPTYLAILVIVPYHINSILRKM